MPQLTAKLHRKSWTYSALLIRFETRIGIHVKLGGLMVPLYERAANWFSMLELNSHMASNFLFALAVGEGSMIVL